ncbi:MAG: flagellar assembly peptidoglycan hydrolase FlgJ [Burkholderiaceae bacterium]
MAGLNEVLLAAGAQKPLQDARALDALKRAAHDDPRSAIRQAAGEFEAMFTRQLLDSMRAALPKSGLFEGPGSEMMTQMLDDQLAKLGQGTQGGLGDMIARHLSRYVDPQAAGPTPAADAANAAPGKPTSSAVLDRLSAVAYQPSHSAPAAAPDLDQVIERAQVVLENVPAWLEASMQPEQPVSGLPASRRSELFVERLWPQARAAEAATGVPAKFIIGQAALESGWGRGEILRPDGSPAFNLFGIKAGSDWRGDTVAVNTTEYVHGRPVQQLETFRAYGSYTEAFADWARLMRENPRYAGVLQAADSVRDFAYGLQAAGYATDPRYGHKLEQVINKTIEIREAGNAG